MSKERRAAARGSWAESMRGQYEAAHFDAAAQLYDEHASGAVPPAAVLLRARIHLKSNSAGAARSLLESHGPFGNAEFETERLMLLGAAYARASRWTTADEHFERSEHLRPALERSAELAYHRAIRFALEHRISKARAWIERARSAESKEGAIRAHFAESLVLAQENRYAEQARVLLKILELAPLGSPDLEARIWATHTLATLSRELHLPHVLRVVDDVLDGEEWPQEFSVNRFETLKAVGWARALRGDYFNGFRRLRTALSICKAPALQVVAHLDRAYLSFCNGEAIWGRQELAEADELASTVAWRGVEGEERVALLLLGEICAGIDAAKAARYLAQYDELPEMRRPLQHSSHDDRLKALADYSRAIVDVALGNKKSAVALLKECADFYARIGYDWRAGRCELRLVEVTGSKAHLARAEEHLRNYPDSWLASELRQAGSTIHSLPPMQRQVFEGLCKGLSNADIAETLGRSEFTVRNHIKMIFKTFGVNSRSALIAEAMRRRLI